MTDLFSPPAPSIPRAKPEAQPELPPCPAPQRTRPMTLCDGRVVDGCSQEWRMECFARHMLSLEQKERDDWMFDLLRRHGEDGVVELRAAMVAIVNTRNGGSGG